MPDPRIESEGMEIARYEIVRGGREWFLSEPWIKEKIRAAMGDRYNPNSCGTEDMLGQISGLIYDLDTAVLMLKAGQIGITTDRADFDRRVAFIERYLR